MENTVTMKLEDYDQLKEKTEVINNALILDVSYDKKRIDVSFKRSAIYKLVSQVLKDNGLLDKYPAMVVVPEEDFYFFSSTIAKEPEVAKVTE